jgi:exodeoxyribonuclease V alpha subunit
MDQGLMKSLLQNNILSPIDVHLAGLMKKVSRPGSEELSLAAALASHHRLEGNICLDLSSMSGKQLTKDDDSPSCPELDEWLSILRGEDAVGKPGEYRPLILDGSRLYLYRYWEYEKNLVDRLKEKAVNDPDGIDRKRLSEGLTRLFSTGSPGETDWQKVAAFASVMKNFCVISGGPGTGKTFTVAKILALLLELSGGTLRIALAAPTGKAAARLQESIKKAQSDLNCPETIKTAIASDASTIHRLLKSIPDSPYFRYDAKNSLPVDVAVIDEASMVDLALMSKLVQAVPASARLILLGDKDQLSSVEAGAVLGDICDTGIEHRFTKHFSGLYQQVTGETIEHDADERCKAGLQDSIIQLKKSFRFGPSSGIGEVSKAVNEGDSPKAFTLLTGASYDDISWRGLPRPEMLPPALKEHIIAGFAPYFKEDDHALKFDFFNRMRLLCAVREGPYGVNALNVLVEGILREVGLIRQRTRWYPGRPILITRNDYTLKLFNGDVGITLPDPEAENELRVFFPGPDGNLRKFLPLRLPEHETVFAMTVHKSQGSEYEKVLFIMPDRDLPVLTRELVYTAITRARVAVEIWGKEEIFKTAVSRRTIRASGLRDALWG